ncbi:glycosyl hydrolase 53 family protein [Aquimarina sp. MMG016]|uniref:glycoside hydrolase family 53 protein n=1 Tax=Aquimarina sp. MMG016 TaxID=2822690 RepID=UPI001B3A76C0|nr:glycosyl hydrolase 53 family protein [Aquimarina sp. MMG016]MBQ4821418.1 glycosyl hydrolase 53 family protein [Aquimarina sp. MMG016]
MIRKVILVLICSVVSSCTNDNTVTNNTPEKLFYKGMDLSFQSELESYNLDYKDQNGNSINLLDYVTSKGTNLIRLRLWHTPENGHNSLEKVKLYALKIKASGADFLLDIHYSDTWADPGNQEPPNDWKGMSSTEIKNVLYRYTKQVVKELKDQGTTPAIVQIGNETNSGFLWNFGKVWNEFNNNWPFYVELSNECYKAIKEVDNNIKTMIHIAGVTDTKIFFEKVEENNGNYDIIGLSYYPQFHGKNLIEIQNNINLLASTFNKDILLTEVSYPFTLDWNDNANNFIGDESQILTEFPSTPNGQKRFLEWVIKVLKEIPDNKGIGFCYWAPDWVAFSGNETTSTKGSSWENQCLFDFDHNALPAIEIFTDN